MGSICPFLSPPRGVGQGCPGGRGGGSKLPELLPHLSHGAPNWTSGRLKEGWANPDLRGEYHQLPEGRGGLRWEIVNSLIWGGTQGSPWSLRWCQSLVDARNLAAGEGGHGALGHGLAWPLAYVLGTVVQSNQMFVLSFYFIFLWWP